MTAWHRSWKADIGLRASGLSLCLIAYTALSHLFAMRQLLAAHAGHALGYALATIGFLAASAGAALTLLGRHLFDEIEVSARWHPRRSPRPPRPSDPRLAPAPWQSLAAKRGR